MLCKVAFGLLLLIVASSCSPVIEKASCPCGRIYMPLCASDGRTYNSMCEFDCQANFVKQKYNKQMTIVKHERCDGSY